jgi:hypothetical protein
VAESQEFDPGTILGRSAVAANVTSAAAADAGNTSGSGAITLDGTAPVAPNAKNGKYRAVCIEPGTDGGIFAVYDPDGVEIGKVAVGATFNNQIKFVIADATDFVAGDAFTITVGIEEADYQHKALDLDGTAGENLASAIAVYGAKTGAGETAKIAAIVRGPAQVRLADLTFPDGITAPQKAEVLNQLAALGIIAR